MRKTSKPPSLPMAERTTAVRPAAGPLTMRLEPLSGATTRPPMMPAMRPATSGAPRCQRHAEAEGERHQEDDEGRGKVGAEVVAPAGAWCRHSGLGVGGLAQVLNLGQVGEAEVGRVRGRVGGACLRAPPCCACYWCFATASAMKRFLGNFAARAWSVARAESGWPSESNASLVSSPFWMLSRLLPESGPGRRARRARR